MPAKSPEFGTLIKGRGDGGLQKWTNSPVREAAGFRRDARTICGET